MPLPAALLSAVSNSVRNRGVAYLARGAVTSLDLADGIISATVRGTDLYDVWIEPVGSLLRASCTCPYFFDQLLICKHIWAVVLAADSRQLITFAADDPAADIEPIDFDEDDTTPQPRVAHLQRHRAPTSLSPAPPRQGPAPWRRQLAPITLSALPPASAFAGRPLPESLVFVIDVAASQAADAVVISVMGRDRKAGGAWRAPRPARLPIAAVRDLPPGDDRRILERLLGGRPYYQWDPIYPDAGEIGPSRIGGALARELLPAICATGRCMALVKEPAAAYLPLVWDIGPPWALAVSVGRDEASSTYVISGVLLRHGTERVPLTDPLIATAGVVITRQSVALLDDGAAPGWLTALRTHGPIAVPFDARPELTNMLLIQPPPLDDVPDELRLMIVDGQPRPALRLTPVTHYGGERFVAELHVDYDGLRISPMLPQPLITTPDSARFIRRDVAAERGFDQVLHHAGFRREWSPAAQAQVPMTTKERLPGAVRTLLEQGWLVEAEGVRFRQSGSVSMHVSSGIDWFELHGAGRLRRRAAPRCRRCSPPPARRQHRRARRRHARHAAGGVAAASTALLARLGTPEGDQLRFRPAQAALLDALLAAQPDVDVRRRVRARPRASCSRSSGIEPADPAAGVHRRAAPLPARGARLARSSSASSASAAAWPTTWGWARRCRCWRCCRERAPSDAGARAAAVAGRRAAVARLQLAAARPRASRPSCASSTTPGAGRARHARAARRLRPRPHHLRHAAPRRRAPEGHRVRLRHPRRGAGDQERRAATSAKAARLLQARAPAGADRHADREPPRRAVEPVRVPEPRHARRAPPCSSRRRRPDAGRGRASRTLLARAAPVHPAPHQGAGRQGPAREDRADPLLRARARRSASSTTSCATTIGARCSAASATTGMAQVEDPGARGAAAPAPGRLPPGPARPRAHAGRASAKLDVLLPQLAEVVDEGHKALVFSQFTSLLAIVRQRLDAEGIAYEYLDGQTRDRAGARRALPDRSRRAGCS